ncbi:aspartate kinase, partial [candidate division KSB1 bacterium]|nr:aspartate kinase [candidate division KSB1 bacterium]
QNDESYLSILKTIEQQHLETVKTLLEIKNQSPVLANVKLLFNELEDILHGVFLIKELTLKTLDLIMSFGERLSTYVIYEGMHQKFNDIEYLDMRKLIKTDANFGSAQINYKITEQNIKNYFDEHPALQFATGFISSTFKDETTTLGRGGSDYTAAILGAALEVDEVEIWTDVSGMMTADPNKVPMAFSISQMTYEEAMEMSHFGAKVIYPPTIQPLLEKSIPLRILNVFVPEFKGTFIGNQIVNNQQYLIRGISSIPEIALIRVQGSGMIGVVGIAGRLFTALAREKVNVILISQASSEHSICVAVTRVDADRASTVLQNEFALEIQAHHIDNIIIEKSLTIIAVVGANMRRTPGIAGKIFQALGDAQINVVAIAQGSSELNISLVLDEANEKKALNVIHRMFFDN